MNNYVTGEIIKTLREKKGLTQSDLANELYISEKTISKWENKRGLPDISLIEPLAKALGVSLIELFNGEIVENHNKCGKLSKLNFYVCPICGNINISLGENIHYCCGIKLLPEEYEEITNLNVENIENEIYINIDNHMSKKDYISFIAYVTTDKVQLKKLYPEQICEARFEYLGKGDIYYYSNRNGLFKITYKK